MPIPFIIAGVIAAGAAIATSTNCRRCDDIFWNSDCKFYCQSCCDAQKRERRIEKEKRRLEQEREMARKNTIRKKYEESRIREEKIIKNKIIRQNKEEKYRLKKIEDIKKEKIKYIKNEKNRQRILLKNRADKKREDILNTIITDFKKNELFQYKEEFQKNIFLEIDKDKNMRLKIINESQKLVLSNKELQNNIEIYIEEA